MANNRSKELQTVIDFCLDHADQATVQRRVELYRGLAEFCGVADESANFRMLADELEAADLRCRQFAFQVKGSR